MRRTMRALTANRPTPPVRDLQSLALTIPTTRGFAKNTGDQWHCCRNPWTHLAQGRLDDPQTSMLDRNAASTRFGGGFWLDLFAAGLGQTGWSVHTAGGRWL